MKQQSRQMEQEFDRETKLMLAQLEAQKLQLQFDTKLIEIMEGKEISMEKIAADLKKANDKLHADISKFKVETTLKEQGNDQSNYGLE